MLSIFAEKPKASVDSIVADLTSKIKDLKQLQQDQLDHSRILSEQAAELISASNEAANEAQRAQAVAKNLEALLQA